MNKKLAGDVIFECPKCKYRRHDQPTREVHHRCTPKRPTLVQLKVVK